MDPDLCEHCHFNVPPTVLLCPHCVWNGKYPNVREVERAPEPEAFRARYDAALEAMKVARTLPVGQRFEDAVARSQAVIARRLYEIERIATSDKEGYVTFYKLVAGGLRIPDGGEWDTLRGIADSFFFPNYREDVRFASLTLDGTGLPHYGDGFMVMRDDMIAHRTTVFEANSAVVARDEDFSAKTFRDKLRGRRVAWAQRGRLALVKHHGELSSRTKDKDFPGIIQKAGPPREPDKDRFLEAHIYGSMTARTLERVVIQRKKVRSPSLLRVLREQLTKVGVPLEEK